MNAAAGVILVLLLCVAAWPWLATGIAWPLALATSVVLGAVIAGMLGTILPDGFVALSAAVVAAWVAALLLRRYRPLAPFGRPQRRENIAGRTIGTVVLVTLAILGAAYLWANAIRPPILVDTLFKWSGPARGLGPIFGLPLRLSALYYGVADSDVGWKFLWSVLNLLPLAALYGALSAQRRGRLVAAGALVAPALAFSYLFWASSGQPALFSSGLVILAWYWTLSEDPRASALALLAASAATWTGAYWGALAGIALVAGAVTHRDLALRAFLLAAGVFLLGRWAWIVDIPWPVVTTVAAYYGSDAWNIARYGPLAFIAAALALRSSGVKPLNWVLLAAAFSTLALHVLEVAGQTVALHPDVVLRVDGNKLFVASLLVVWFLTLRMSALAQPGATREA